MSLLDQYRVTQESRASEKSLLERYKVKPPREDAPIQQEPFPEEGENDLDRDIERNVARGTSRILETVGGLPGDLYSFAKGLFGADTDTYLPTSQSLKKFSERILIRLH